MGGKAKLLGRRLKTAQVSWLPSVNCLPSVPTTSWEAGRLPQGVVHLIMVSMMAEALNFFINPSLFPLPASSVPQSLHFWLFLDIQFSA